MLHLLALCKKNECARACRDVGEVKNRSEQNDAGEDE